MEPKLVKPLSLYDLLKKGLNAPDDRGRTPVVVAMDNQLFDKADTIIAMGANLYISDNSGRSLIDMIRESGDSKLIVSAIKRGVHIQSVLPPSRITPEFLSANPELVKLIADKAIDISSLPQDTILAIQTSLSNGLAAVQEYINNGGNINAQDNNGNTLLMFASINKSPEILKYLVEQGADVNLSNHNGTTALMLTAENNCVDSLKFLLDNNANKNAQDKQGDTSFMYAVRKDNVEVVQVLDEYNADATITNNKGENILFAAVDNNSKKSFEYIIENLVANADEAEKNAPNLEININIQETTQINKPEDKKLEPQPAMKTSAIIAEPQPQTIDTPAPTQKKKIDINHQDNNGDTALMHAARLDNLDFVKTLGMHNADVTIINKNGEDLVMIAHQHHSNNTMKYIVDNFVDFGDEDMQIADTLTPKSSAHIKSHRPKHKIKITQRNSDKILSFAVETNDNELIKKMRKLDIGLDIDAQIEEIQKNINTQIAHLNKEIEQIHNQHLAQYEKLKHQRPSLVQLQRNKSTPALSASLPLRSHRNFNDY